MTTNDDRLAGSTLGQSANGTPLGLILNQLIIITLVLKQAYGITDDDFTLMQAPDLIPSINPQNILSVVNP